MVNKLSKTPGKRLSRGDRTHVERLVQNIRQAGGTDKLTFSGAIHSTEKV